MVRIDQLPPPRGPADATPEGIQDYMEYAARVLAQQGVAMSDAIRGRRKPCELDGMEDVPIDGWWGEEEEVAASPPDDPRITYERFIDACRLLVEETRRRDGRDFAYFGYEPGRVNEADMWLKNFANCLRSAKYQKLMPHWWNPQHEIAMFRYGTKKGSDFYILDTRKMGDIIKVWGSPTARTITGLAARLEKKLMKRSDDEMSTALAEVFLAAHSTLPEYIGSIPTRERGEGQGEGVPCRYGVKCRRRDCWFMHPRLEIPTGDLVRNEDGDVSSKDILDHCIEMANGKKNLIKLIDCYQLCMKTDKCDVRKALIDPRSRIISRSEAEKFVYEEANAGNSMAQYLWGKMLGDPAFTCMGKGGVQTNTMIKFMTASALTGNAYAQMGLASIHSDAGYLAVAIHWWKRALALAAIPEAAYRLGVAYAKVEYPEAGVPIQYKRAAKYYSHALGPALPDVNPLSFDQDDMDSSLMYSVMILGPGNTLQHEYQKYSIHNLDIVDRYLNCPVVAPVPDTKNPPPPIESTETCALCHRRPNVGEKELASCKRCYKVKYCNKICQRGHWSEGHKAECQA